jgi:phosphatidylserine/phosphatidylglycerophosphate/cardiolipin synthase-like enzyme
MHGPGEPAKSHLKWTVVDDEATVLGSGNMDRASWFTSQELGVALLSKEKAENVRECVLSVLKDRVEWIC